MGIRGEFTIVFSPVKNEKGNDLAALRKTIQDADSEFNDVVPSSSSTNSGQTQNPNDRKQQIVSALQKLRSEGCMRSEAVKIVAKNDQLPKSIVYDLALKIKIW